MAGISSAQQPSTAKRNAAQTQKEKLRRLPHLFGRALVLPLPSDADVSVREFSDCLVLTAAKASSINRRPLTEEVEVQTIEIYPGVLKVVVGGCSRYSSESGETTDRWRFNLPAWTRPEMATARYVRGDLIVIVPKVPNLEKKEGNWS